MAEVVLPSQMVSGQWTSSGGGVDARNHQLLAHRSSLLMSDKLMTPHQLARQSAELGN